MTAAEREALAVRRRALSPRGVRRHSLPLMMEWKMKKTLMATALIVVTLFDVDIFAVSGANAVYGRPGTPVSVAGTARRTTRRANAIPRHSYHYRCHGAHSITHC
jgi:hypothetical protein